ncbi:Gamma-glutamylputrescine oxidoreductase [Metarhizium anisopliae]|nr:Gamma-glutamylputrescine oxidoreductase [Metarhizium anisopliae]
MTPKVDASVIAELAAQALQDPQLPRENPTVSFWQMPPHPSLSEVQSPSLPSTTDYAVIGSGVTGCSVAKHLLDNSPSDTFSVTVFEARALTSGATGRNGGLLTSFVPGDYKLLSDRFGHEQATKIARYANRTLEKMHQLANSSPEFQAASDVRRTLDVVLFQDQASRDASKESWALYEAHVPEDKGKAEFLTPEQAEAKYGVRAKAGAAVFPNGAFWPYRLITRVWGQVLDRHGRRVSVETRTPVTEITHDAASDPEHPYVLHTPRGEVRAGKIVHATNGHAGHLLPGLRGKIYPLRGTMSVQKATEAFGNRGGEVTWSVLGGGTYDPGTEIVDVGLLYSNQNPRTGDIFIGGEKAKIREVLVSDDSQIGAPCVENLSSVLPTIFTRGWDDGEKPEVCKIWSGIMGFTADSLPIIGALPLEFTKRGDEGGEWIAAGFNGYGMPLCWSAGEAVAKMLLGVDVGDFLPEVFAASRERLGDDERMSPRAALDLFFGGHV